MKNREISKDLVVAPLFGKSDVSFDTIRVGCFFGAGSVVLYLEMLSVFQIRSEEKVSKVLGLFGLTGCCEASGHQCAA